ncbi:hypothetical protein [Methanobrevibacter sp.]|uniref:hypothetical protein n=1 Tax=Methanobrevibacter sp. TaxID=66852 RepID=UPI00388ECC4A
MLVKEVEERLNISCNTSLEVRKKLKIGKFVTEEDFERIERFVNDVRKAHKRITLSTINRFLIEHKLEDYR